MSDMTEWLAEALAVCDAATDGPWEADTYMTKQRRVIDIESGGLKTEPSKLYGSLSIIPSDGVYGEFDGHDAEFIAHARTGYPAALRALQAVLERAESWELQATCEGTINPVWAEAIKHCATDLRRAIEEAGK